MLSARFEATIGYGCGVAVRRPIVVLHYAERAVAFHRAASDLMELDQDTYSAAVGLLSVHGCIALADALLAAVLPSLTKNESHDRAAQQLRDWCSSSRLSSNGIKHLEWLLKRKNRFSYDDDRVDSGELQMAKVKMDQFFAWAFRNFPEVAQLREDANGTT